MAGRSTAPTPVILAGVAAVGGLGAVPSAGPEPGPNPDSRALVADSADALASEPVEEVRVETDVRADRIADLSESFAGSVTDDDRDALAEENAPVSAVLGNDQAGMKLFRVEWLVTTERRVASRPAATGCRLQQP